VVSAILLDLQQPLNMLAIKGPFQSKSADSLPRGYFAVAFAHGGLLQ
jgi:hypothetical protein